VYDLPQQYTEPFSKIEQTLYPGVANETALMPVEWFAFTGVLLSEVVPSAKVPNPLYPQHFTSPVLSKAQVKSLPADTETAVLLTPRLTSTGVFLLM
jgi:hypothetical protein